MKTLVFFTASFPFGRGEQFIETEILYLTKVFKKIIIVPGTQNGPKRSLPPQVELDTSFAEKTDIASKHKFSYYLKGLFSCLRSAVFYEEIADKPKILLNFKYFHRLVSYLFLALETQKWILSRHFNAQHTVFYSYWLSTQTLGTALAQKTISLKLVSRMHRADLYEEANIPPYLPCRSHIIKKINKLYSISQNGQNYFYKKYPHAWHLLKISRLGVRASEIVNMPSQDGIFRLVSCSFIAPVKRIHLIVKAISHLADSFPDKKIEWHHLGDGPLRTEIESLSVQKLPSSVCVKIYGMLSNKDVLAFYKRQNLDVFVNVSRSEGIPVSIMEAQSCGIPVIATNVGGVSEIVNHKNGILLDACPEPAHIAQSLEMFMNPDLQHVLEKRRQSLKNWASVYNAETNYMDFAYSLLDK